MKLSWTRIAGVLGAVALVATVITKGEAAYEILRERFAPESKPQVRLRAMPREGGGDCVELAFSRLPSDFVLDTIRFEVIDGRGPFPLSGDMAASVEELSVNYELSIADLQRGAMIEFPARLQSTQPNDAFYVDFCPHLPMRGSTAQLTLRPQLFAPGDGGEIDATEMWSEPAVEDSADVTIELATPRNLAVTFDRDKTTLLPR